MGAGWGACFRILGGKEMKNPVWVLLVVLGVLMGALPCVVYADPIRDADVSIGYIIDDGNPEDFHDKNGWLVAGSGISSTIRVTYTGNASVDIHSVRFASAGEDGYGSITGNYAGYLPYYDGIFAATRNRAGNATIRLQINYSVNGTEYEFNRTVYQPIDHGLPMNMRCIAFENEVSIGDEMNVTVVMEDTYGNAVTSLYEDAVNETPEMVTFETTCYAGCGLSNGTVCDVPLVCVPVNAEGAVVATFTAGTDAGPKYLIHIVPPAVVDDTWLTITALAEAEPYGMEVLVIPNTDTTPYVPADGESKFYLIYTLFDQYGNPSGNQAVTFTDDVIGDVFSQRTNGNGQIMFTFGPYDIASTFTISAEAVSNTSVRIDQQVRFTNTSPEDMLLTANPQSMPSADVEGATVADILAKVMDENGNGVPGEEVEFWIVNKTGGYCDAQIAEPNLDTSTAKTNEDGIASVFFTPGAFESNVNADNYNATASESCTVVARWGSRTRSIDLEWKNYPYLRVETEVDQETVGVGDTVIVTVRLIGDGWALHSEPIDVMLCADRSGSMSWDSPPRIESLKSALKIFNGQMSEERDKVGLTSFGGDATLDLPFTSNHNEVDSAIDALDATGWTSMRQGLYLALKENIENGREGARQAVVLLSDGDYNRYGDPLARGDGDTNIYFSSIIENYTTINDLSLAEQNLSVYAANNNVTIYSIAFKDGISGDGIETLQILANSTGGKYYYAPNSSQLADIYTSIAGELKTEAGVNTAMDMCFETLEVNNISHPNTGDNPIVSYEYEDGVSTLVKSWNDTGSEGSPNIRDETLNQTVDWAATRSLNFSSTDIGTIHLGQTWQAVFRLNVSKAGNINIFGGSSAISFNNGTDSLSLPKTYITAVPNLNATGINFTDLEVYDLKCVEAEDGCAIENDLTIQWNLNYSGAFTANQSLYYQKVDDGVWINFAQEKDGTSEGPQNHSHKLYVADFPPGKYNLRVWATARDAPDSIAETSGLISIGMNAGNYILLE